MRKIVIATVAAALATSPVYAQSFTFEVEFSEPEFVGGLGEEGRYGRGGTMSGPYRTSLADGSTANGNVDCVGMDQPDGSLFQVHLACQATDSDGSEASLIWGCNRIAKDAGMTCVGGIESKSGPQKGARGNVTMHLKEGTSVGTGQWFEM